MSQGMRQGTLPCWLRDVEAEVEVRRLRRAIDGAPCPVMPCCRTGKPTHADRPARPCWKAIAIGLRPIGGPTP